MMLISPQWTININFSERERIFSRQLFSFSSVSPVFEDATLKHCIWGEERKERYETSKSLWNCFCWCLKLCGTKDDVFFNYPSFHSRHFILAPLRAYPSWETRFHRLSKHFMAALERRFNRSLIGLCQWFERPILFYPETVVTCQTKRLRSTCLLSLTIS